MGSFEECQSVMAIELDRVEHDGLFFVVVKHHLVDDAIDAVLEPTLFGIHIDGRVRGDRAIANLP